MTARTEDLGSLLDELASLADSAARLNCKALAIVLGSAYVAAADGTLDELADLLAVRHMLTKSHERN